MLTASRLELEHPVTAMVVSQHQQNFSPSERTQGVYFAFSDNFIALRENDSDSSDYEMVERGDMDSTSTESETSSPVLLPNDIKAAVNEEHGGPVSPAGESSEKTATPCVKPKHGTAIIGLPDNLMAEAQNEKPEKKPKKKKWRVVSAEEMGFKLTLFPRAPVDNTDTTTGEIGFFEVLDAELDSVGDKIRPFRHLLQLEGSGLAKEEKFLRRDSDRREQKAHRQVKSKNIMSVLNNRGRKTLYIHFRLYKMHPFLHCSNLQHPNLPSPPRRGEVCLEVAKAAAKVQQRSPGLALTPSFQGYHAPPPQNLAHALADTSNAASELPTDIISFLINIQHRELTPEDYEILLRLDEGIAPKTVAQDVVSAFKTDVVDESSAGGVCSVCMEVYELGQQRKFLPCEHVFHEHCIDMWLTNSSQNCPLDGLPVGFS